MSPVGNSDTLTVTNLVAAYRSAYYSVYAEHPEACEYIGDGYFHVDGKELHRVEFMNAIRDLRHQAVQVAEAKIHQDSVRGRLFRLIKRIRQIPDSSETLEQDLPSPSRRSKNVDTMRFNKDDLAALQKASRGRQTRPLDNDYVPPSDKFIPRSRQEEAQLSEHPTLVISVENVRMRIEIINKVFFGRDIAQMGSTKVFDLTSFGGVRKGISRRHAEINLTHDHQLELVDLGSTNGTYLNYKKLKPLQAYPIRDGDHIRLGKISIEIYFEH